MGVPPEIREEMVQKAQQVALSLFLGLVVESVPEGILMGFLAAEDHLSMVFIVSIFVANFPEAFAASSLLCQARWSTPSIIGMWTGGALIACISALMLPEAFERSGHGGNLLMSSGFMCTCGFLMAVAMKVWEVA